MLSIIFLALALPFLVNGSPMICNEVTTQYSQTVFPDSSFQQHQTGKFVEIISDSNFTYSAKYNLFGSGNLSYIKLYDVQGFDTTFNASIFSLCYWFLDCHKTFAAPANIKLLQTDPFVRFDLNFGTNETFFIDGFFYDAGSLSHWDGTVFTQNNSCVYDIYNDSTLIKNRTTCCSSFAPSTQTPVSSTPRCKKFRSRTTVHNIDFTIFGTSSVNYTLSGNQVAMVGDWDNKDTFGFEFGTRFYESSDPAKKFAINATLPAGDSKNFFTTIFLVDNVPIAVQDVVAFSIVGNNTLRAGGALAYTPNNDCSYYSFKSLRGGVPLPATVEMCCKEFES